MAKHVEPIVADWRTGVQIPPAPPNKHLRASTDVLFCACCSASTGPRGLLVSVGVHLQPRPLVYQIVFQGLIWYFWNTKTSCEIPNACQSDSPDRGQDQKRQSPREGLCDGRWRRPADANTN